MFQQTSAQSAGTWQELMDLRGQREVIERWLSSCSLPDGMQQYLHAMLGQIEDQLQVLTKQLGMSCAERR